MSKFFSTLCVSLGTKLVTVTEYHPQSKRQVKRFEKLLVARLRHYIDDHRIDWDMYVQPLANGYIGQ